MSQIRQLPPVEPTPFEIVRAVEVLREFGIQINFPRLNNLKLATVEETAQLLRVDPSWVRRHFSEFPGLIKLEGGAVRIPIRDLENFLERWRATRPAKLNLSTG